MKNQWLNFFSGSVKVRVVGGGFERFINECVRRNIQIWNVKKLGSKSSTFHMHLRDLYSLREVVRKHDCKITFLERYGMPFFLRKVLLNGGFLIGTILCLFIITFFSNMVWGIEINGAKPETEHLIRKELKKMGIQRGKLQFTLADVEQIQRQLTNSIEQLTWIGVQLNGTTYHFQVVEKNQPEPRENFSPSNLVATKKAIITDMFVEEGQPLISINDYVNKGQILVSGEIGKEGEKKLVPARGKIYGEVWYKSEIVVELSTKLNVYTGNNNTKHFAAIGNISIPIWGFTNVKYQSYDVETDEKKFKFLKWEIPISYKKQIIRENEEVERKYTEKEAINVAKERGRNNLRNKLAEDAIIKNEKVLLQTTNNGKVKLIIKYDVIENIVTTIPLVQGD